MLYLCFLTYFPILENFTYPLLEFGRSVALHCIYRRLALLLLLLPAFTAFLAHMLEHLSCKQMIPTDGGSNMEGGLTHCTFDRIAREARTRRSKQGSDEREKGHPSS